LRILFLTDIHANLEGMEACVASVADHDMIVNLGDIVGYGASPNEVSDRSRELCDIFVRGNHDKACTGLGGIDDFNPIAGMAAIWTQQTLTPENFEWLRALPQGPIELDHIWPEKSASSGQLKVQCVHGSPLDEDEYIIVMRDAYQPLCQQVESAWRRKFGSSLLDEVIDAVGGVGPSRPFPLVTWTGDEFALLDDERPG